MRRVVAIILLALFTPHAFSQDKLPPRFDGFPKTGPFRLTRILGTPEIHATFNPTSAFSADGKYAAYVEDQTTGAEDQPTFRSRLLLWEVGSSNWPREIDIDGVGITALALSRDGSQALLGGQTLPAKAKKPQSFVSLFDLRKNAEIRKLLTDDKMILAVALSPDENAALAGTTEDLRIWDIKKGKSRVIGDKNKTGVTVLAYLPDGKQFLAGYRGGEIRLFDVGADKPARTYQVKGTHEFVWRLAVAADGKRFASADFQTAVTLWDIVGKEINTLRMDKPASEEAVTALALAADGKTVVTTWNKANSAADDFACTKLLAWDGQAGKTRWSQDVSYRGLVPILVKDEKLLIGGGPNVYDEWSLKNGAWLGRVSGHKGAVNVLGVLHNGDLVSAGMEGMALTWRKGKLANRSVIHKGAITALAIDKTGYRWISVGADWLIRDWPLQAQKKVDLPKSHGGPIPALAFSAAGNWIASGSGDRTAKTWDLDTRKEIATFAGHSAAVNAVAISPDDRWLATGSDDATIKVWPIKNGKLDPDRDTITLEKHTKPITCLTFTPDGKRLLSGSQDQKLLVWDWQKGSMDFMIVGHKNWINAILLLDAKTVLTAGDDLSVCAWNLEDGMELGQIDFGTVGDCPRCLARIGPDRFAVGSSSWLIYEFQLTKSKGTTGSSKR